MTTSERPHRGRGRAIGEGVTWTAQWGLRLLLVGAGVVVLWLLIGALWSIVLPVLLAVILATVLWPPAAWLRRHRFPPALAATTVLLAGIVMLAGLIALISTTVSSGIGQVTESAVGGIATIQGWIAGQLHPMMCHGAHSSRSGYPADSWYVPEHRGPRRRR